MARVLVVDDEEDLRAVARMFLELKGHEAVEAASGAEALDLVSDGDLDAVLLDLRMPDIDGWGVLDALRADGRIDAIAVIVVSAHADDAVEARARALGCRGYLKKPFSSATLMAALDDALGSAGQR